MLTTAEIQALASRPERPQNCVLTVYLNIDQSRQANLNRVFETQLKDMLTSVENSIRDEDELAAFAKASKRIQDFVVDYKVSAIGLVAVFDASDEFFSCNEVGFPVENRIQWGREACVQPLAEAADERAPVGIVLLDRANVRVFTMHLGRIEERLHLEFDRKKLRHTKTIGMDHMESAARAQHKADAQVRLNFRHVTARIDLIFEQHGAHRIILAGSSGLAATLRSVWPKRLAERVIGRFDLPIDAPVEQIRNTAARLAEEFEGESEKTLVEELVTSAAKSNHAVVGLGHTLQAINQQRVWQLVYAEASHSPGYECEGCGALSSIEQTSCSICDSKLSQVDDVVELAVDHALRKGARIEVVRGGEAESELMNNGGIGAFLRTRPGAIRAS